MEGYRDPQRSLELYRSYGPPIIALAFLAILGLYILLVYGVVLALWPVVFLAIIVLVLLYIISQGGLRFIRGVLYSIGDTIDDRPPPYHAPRAYVNPYRTHPPPGHAPPRPGRCRSCGGQLHQGHPNCPHCGSPLMPREVR